MISTPSQIARPYSIISGVHLSWRVDKLRTASFLFKIACEKAINVSFGNYLLSCRSAQIWNWFLLTAPGVELRSPATAYNNKFGTRPTGLGLPLPSPLFWINVLQQQHTFQSASPIQVIKFAGYRIRVYQSWMNYRWYLGLHFPCLILRLPIYLLHPVGALASLGESTKSIFADSKIREETQHPAGSRVDRCWL